MGMPTASIAQNPNNPPMQPQSSGGKGMAGGTPPVSTQSMRQDQVMPQGGIGMMTSFGGQEGQASLSLGSQGGGKGGGKGGSIQPSNMTMTATSGQPTMGKPNPYPNTTGSWDNSATQQPPAQMSGGKGKGA